MKTPQTGDNNLIKIGDRLKCVDADASFNRLAAGAVYTAEAHPVDGSPTVIVRGATHSLERFEKIN